MARGFEEERPAAFKGMPAKDQQDLHDASPLRAKLKLGPGGRVVIPAGMREKLGLSEGDVLMATFESGEMKLVTLVESVRRAQALVRKSVPAGRNLVDELLEDRRLEVAKERRGG
jgi:AbrB family looped-hinge helix DNA binding protein